jgi:hypothetical protein
VAVVSPRQVCVCGCGARAVALHHVVYQQQLRVVARQQRRDALERTLRERALVGDVRNLVPVAFACHGQHHSRQAPLDLRVLPDSVFEFAAEVLGPGPAWSYLDRRYRGRDPRMDAMLRADEAATVTGTERKERP